MATSPADDPASRLEHVTDDLSPHEECRAWLVAEMRNDRHPDELLNELLANGWGRDDAEQLVDEARLRTRSARSVLGARDEVAALAAKGRPGPVLRAPDHGSAMIAGLILGIARGVQWIVSRETREIRRRVQHGLCYRCGHDVKKAGDQCPACGSPVVRRAV